jgi:hypothetical protein
MTYRDYDSPLRVKKANHRAILRDRSECDSLNTALKVKEKSLSINA